MWERAGTRVRLISLSDVHGLCCIMKVKAKRSSVEQVILYVAAAVLCWSCVCDLCHASKPLLTMICSAAPCHQGFCGQGPWGF